MPGTSPKGAEKEKRFIKSQKWRKGLLGGNKGRAPRVQMASGDWNIKRRNES